MEQIAPEEIVFNGRKKPSSVLSLKISRRMVGEDRMLQPTYPEPED
jgi:hypothetical protein